MAETIAAVIPLYNKEPYIGRAIISVLNQTVPVDEIIIVDDASTDGSLERVKIFEDARIKIFRRTDPRQRGLPATRNHGISSAQSHWIAFLDADDRWHENFIEEIRTLIRHSSDPIGLLFTGWESIWPNGVVTRDAYSESCGRQGFQRLDIEAFVSAWLACGSCPVFPSGVAIRRDTLLGAGLFREECRRGEDKDMWLRVLAITDALYSPEVCSSYYREIPGAMDHTITTNVRHCIFRTLEEMIAHGPTSRRRLLMRLFNHQAIEYARGVAGRERLSPEVYRGFYVSIDPANYLLLRALSCVPVRLQQLIRQGILWTWKITRSSKSREPSRGAPI